MLDAIGGWNSCCPSSHKTLLLEITGLPSEKCFAAAVYYCKQKSGVICFNVPNGKIQTFQVVSQELQLLCSSTATSR